MQRPTWKIVLTGILIIAAFVYLAPSLIPGLPNWWKKVLPSEKLSLGLDLRGGIHLLYEVQTEKAVEATLGHMLSLLTDEAGKKRINLSKAEVIEGTKIEIEIEDKSKEVELRKIIDAFTREIKIISTEGGHYVLGLDDETIKTRKEASVDQALETIRNRIDQYGVSEPSIQREGGNRLLIQLPGVTNPLEAKKLIQSTALLEFKLIDHENEPKLQELLKDESFRVIDDIAKARVNEIVSGKIPAGSEWHFEREADPTTGELIRAVPRLVKKKTLLTGEYLTDAGVRLGSQLTNQPYVTLDFDSDGARIFERITAENVNKFLAIILDDTVYSAPRINQRISGGSAIIEGRFTVREAHNLAIVLRAGSLPAPLITLEERSVGPSLGRDMIKMGEISILIGSLLIIIFMAVYYRWMGLVANLALILNILFIMAFLAVFKATLTLPGLAGILLTVGMAVDANVIINERIREELRIGKTPRASVEAGYEKAFSAILDSNLTTLISGLVLFQFGTGPIRGFAVTLSIGIATSMFTAIFVTRAVIEQILMTRRIKRLSI